MAGTMPIRRTGSRRSNCQGLLIVQWARLEAAAAVHVREYNRPMLETYQQAILGAMAAITVLTVAGAIIVWIRSARAASAAEGPSGHGWQALLFAFIMALLAAAALGVAKSYDWSSTAGGQSSGS